MADEISTSNAPAASAFIVRIWHERLRTPDQKAVWRGVVVDVTTNEQLAFQSLEILLAFMIEKSGIEPDINAWIGGF